MQIPGSVNRSTVAFQQIPRPKCVTHALRSNQRLPWRPRAARGSKCASAHRDARLGSARLLGPRRGARTSRAFPPEHPCRSCPSWHLASGCVPAASPWLVWPFRGGAAVSLPGGPRHRPRGRGWARFSADSRTRVSTRGPVWGGRPWESARPLAGPPWRGQLRPLSLAVFMGSLTALSCHLSGLLLRNRCRRSPPRWTL